MDKIDPRSGFPVDEHGEIYQADLTDELTPSPASREKGAHHANRDGEDVDSQAGDDFMREHKGPKPTS